MTIKAPLLGAGIALGLALLLLPAGEEEWKGPVVLNPHPPEAQRWGLAWDLGTLPQSQGNEPPHPRASEAEVLPNDVLPADPGIWATPAEFAERE